MDKIRIHRFETIVSTNSWLRSLDGGTPGCEYELAVTEFQTAGRGQRGSTWESEPGMNLLFSILAHPGDVKVQEQFFISESIALAVADCVSDLAGDGFTVKWPNDIYWNDCKLAGILIENTLQGNRILDSIIGVGIDVNQTVFKSDAPNPVSLKNIAGRDFDRDALLDDILARFISNMNASHSAVHERYHARLYRSTGYHMFRDSGGQFLARIDHVQTDGCLVLDVQGQGLRTYEFKQVAYVPDEK